MGALHGLAGAGFLPFDCPEFAGLFNLGKKRPQVNRPDSPTYGLQIAG
jgi:hypothetical protein